MNPGISVIIPNYNGKNLLEKNIPSVLNALKSSDITDFEIIIADDASPDTSVKFVKSNYPDIILIENSVNLGFGGNMNSGISKATKNLVLLLNNDVVLTDGYFKTLLPYFNQTDTFGVMSRIVGLDSDQIQDGAKYPVYTYANIAPNTNYTCKSQSSLYSFYLSGANALVDRRKLIELGGFDETFNPFYLEDVDLGLRAWRLGYKCYYEHNAICRHPSTSTIKKEFSKSVNIVSKRNKMLLHFIHLQGFELVCFLGIQTIKSLFRTLFLDFNYTKSYLMFLSRINKGLHSKSKLRNLQKQKNVQISLRDVRNTIMESIKRSEIERF
jgi:GT2 family glycosyltransferase